MTRGPKPKPTALKIANGNPGKRALPKNEPKPNSTLPDVPEFLDEEARAEWDRICSEAAPGVLSEDCRPALATYCMAWSRMLLAQHKLETEGYVHETERGCVKSPWTTIGKEATLIVKAFLVEFGFTPSSRTRINAPVKSDVHRDAEKFASARPTIPIFGEQA